MTAELRATRFSVNSKSMHHKGEFPLFIYEKSAEMLLKRYILIIDALLTFGA